MTDETLLLRQIHPSFVQNGRVTSQAFRPTPKDQLQLSVDNGDRIAPEAAWKRFIGNPACSSAGVMAMSYAECSTCRLPVVQDERLVGIVADADFLEIASKLLEHQLATEEVLADKPSSTQIELPMDKLDDPS